MVDSQWVAAGKKVIERLKRDHFDAFFVGGFVRDSLLNRPIFDIDIATSATAQQIKTIFKETFTLGKKEQTIVVRESGYRFEITTFRSKNGDIAEDLLLRDFTINALAMDERLNLIDPHGFYKDLQAGIIRHCLPKEATINSDPLRMLRALRMFSHLQFTFERETFQQIENNAFLLQHIPIERVAAELEKLWIGRARKASFRLFLQLNMVHPVTFLEKATVERFIAVADRAFYTTEQFWTLFALIQPSFSLKRLPLSKDFKREIESFRQLYNRRVKEGWNNLLLYDATLQQVERIEHHFHLLHHSTVATSLSQLKKRYEQLPIFSRQDLQITSAHLMKHRKKEGGPWLEQTFREIERAVLNREIENDRNTLLTFAEREWRKNEGKAT